MLSLFINNNSRSVIIEYGSVIIEYAHNGSLIITIPHICNRVELCVLHSPALN